VSAEERAAEALLYGGDVDEDTGNGEAAGSSTEEPASASDTDRDGRKAAAANGRRKQSNRSGTGAVSRAMGKVALSRSDKASLTVEDDWNDELYQARIDAVAEAEAAEEDADEAAAESAGNSAGGAEAAPAAAKRPPEAVFPGGLRIPRRISASLFPYQLSGVRWMWELHKQRVGGILGDEMGLGKTAQVAALLGSLKHNGLLRPSLVVCPATVISHWVRELTTWHPALRVLVLHESSLALSSGRATRRQVVHSVLQRGDVLVTTYEGLRLGGPLMQAPHWGYVVLDEGHRVRNPDAAITAAAKSVHTVHRLILTGAPIQNRLRELWSLVDFVYPGRLGSLPMFESQFAAPIAAGGWSHASQLQLQTAVQCAVVLRDLIAPYLLRRLKRDVAAALPPKTEQVLFCRLTSPQREAYLRFLTSREVGDVLEGRLAAFRAVGILRKICNHPSLLEPADVGGGEAARSRDVLDSRAAFEAAQREEEAAAAGGSSVRSGRGGPPADRQHPALRGSGKMLVTAEVLRLWYSQGHRVLLFCQGRQMLSLIESWVRQATPYRYLRMDGTTAVRDRQVLVDTFNDESSGVFLFLLTTRVGGVGINLIGADRVLIFDPDWNPR
jgi:DNA excision repair protein ERCC-6